MSERRIRVLLSCLLVVSATLFAIGVAIERHDNGERTAARQDRLAGVLLADAGNTAETGGAEGEPESGGETHASESTPPTESGGESTTERHAESTGKGQGSGETAAQRRAERSGERVFGIDTESTPLVVAAVLVSLAFVALLWLTPSPWVALAIVGFALVAAVFDVREVFHQIDESRGGLAVIAATVAVLHLAAAALAVVLVRFGRAHRQILSRA